VQELSDDRAALSGALADGRRVVEASGLLEYSCLFKVGVRRVIVLGSVVFELEFVECSLDFFHKPTYGKAFVLLITHVVLKK